MRCHSYGKQSNLVKRKLDWGVFNMSRTPRPQSFRSGFVEAFSKEVHDAAARLLEFKKERLWHLHRNETLRYDIVWLLKWTAVVSQDFLTLIYERHQAVIVTLAQFVSICALCEHQWFLENWVKNAMAAIRHVLTSSKPHDWIDMNEHRWLSTEPARNSPRAGKREIPLGSRSQI